MTILYGADVVVPITSPPIVDGAVAVERGRIVGVGPLVELRGRFVDAPVQRWDGAMVPGLVNAHTHLQYTSFAAVGVEPFEDYTAWSIRFVEEYDARPHEDWLGVARSGAEAMIAHGITAIGDVVTDFEVRDVLYDLGIPGVAYLELIGVDLEDWEGGVGDRLRNAVASAPTTEATTVGISPHAPYSIDMPVLTAMAEMAHELDVRLHIHVAESDGEDEFYRTGTGSLADRVRDVATRRVAVLEQGGTGLGTAEFVQSVGVLGPTCHIAHGVYLGPEGRGIMAAEQTVVTLCPRSNRIVGVDSPPVADFLIEGVPFAVGTDSLGSSPSIDLLHDVAELRRLALDGGYDAPDLDERLLWAATMGGAVALGLGDQLGSLEVGKRADLAVFDVGAADVVRQLVDDTPTPCLVTLINGHLRYGPPGF